MVLSAFERLAQKDPQIQFVCIGEGPERELLEDMTCKAEAPTRERIHLLGYVESPMRLLDGNGVFVSLSKFESFGLVALEAAMTGAPMVLSRIPPWTGWFRDGIDCLFVDPHDVNGIDRAIRTLLDNPHLCQEIASNGKKVAMRIAAPETIGKAWRDLYESLLYCRATD